MFFKCKHPFNRLGVETEHTVENIDRDHDVVRYHLFCQKCGEKITLSHARIIGTVEEFLKRK